MSDRGQRIVGGGTHGRLLSKREPDATLLEHAWRFVHLPGHGAVHIRARGACGHVSDDPTQPDCANDYGLDRACLRQASRPVFGRPAPQPSLMTLCPMARASYVAALQPLSAQAAMLLAQQGGVSSAHWLCMACRRRFFDETSTLHVDGVRVATTRIRFT
jgi:hypothetical protein